jgi:hypothetical protein
MAKVKITGHASGTGVITVTAPNTSTDRTITLPDATATIATTADVTAATFNPNAAQVFNESGADVDFRVESDTVTHALFVQGSDGRVGIGGTPTNFLSLFPTEQGNIRKIDFGLYNGGTDNTFVQTAYHQSNGNVREIGLEGSIVNFYTGADSGTSTSNRLSITADGRGVSQFTAKNWINYDGAGNSIRDSHNISSVTDRGTGQYTVNFDVDMANAQYCALTGNTAYNIGDGDNRWSQRVTDVATGSAQIVMTQTYVNGFNYEDASHIFLAVFGD